MNYIAVWVCVFEWLHQWRFPRQQSVVYRYSLIFRQHTRLLSTFGWKSKAWTCGNSWKRYIILFLILLPSSLLSILNTETIVAVHDTVCSLHL